MTARVKLVGGELTSTNVYLGIDQSYTGFGMTFLGEDGSYQTSVAKFDSMGVTRLLNIQNYIIENIMVKRSTGHVIQATAIEGYAYGSQMANMLGELGGTVKLSLVKARAYMAENACYPYIVSPSMLKKYATGKGNVQKNQMLLQVYKKWGVEFKDDNAADSFALAQLISGNAILEYEKEVYDKLQSPEYREIDVYA